jgi:hypothetical protein
MISRGKTNKIERGREKKIQATSSQINNIKLKAEVPWSAPTSVGGPDSEVVL